MDDNEGVVDTDADAAAPAAPDPVDGEGPATADGFAALELDDRLLSAIAALGYEEPTPIQREAIPPLLAGRDLLAEAPTGTGKTAAFALPTLQRIPIGQAADGSTSALVLVPTRELAMQVAEALTKYGRGLGARVLPVYGGQPIGQQLRGLRRGVDVVVATPGRAVDHLKRGSLRFDAVSVVILDEADEMLDMGFADDLEAILSATPAERQTALFSATISPTITRIAKRHLRDPARIKVHAEKPSGDGGALVRQVAYVVRRTDKLAALCRILDVEDPTSALVFGRTRGEVDDLAEALSARGHDAGALHGGLSQEGRDRMMNRFRDGSLDVLVATDVAARGLDIEGVSHVVNYDVPSNPDAYVHRIGRTGRAGPRGRGDHARRAARASAAAQHRGRHALEVRDRQPADRGRPARASDRGPARQPARGAAGRWLRPLPRRGRAADRRVRPGRHRAGGGQPDRGCRRPGRRRGGAVLAAARRRAAAAGCPSRASRRRDPGGPVRAPVAGRGPTGPSADRPGSGGPWVRLFVGGGRRAGIRPGDLVGAITNEAGVPGSVVGAIQINDAFSLVDVQASVADDVGHALAGATIRGRRLQVRRDR